MLLNDESIDAYLTLDCNVKANLAYVQIQQNLSDYYIYNSVSSLAVLKKTSPSKIESKFSSAGRLGRLGHALS
jgi:hypothetical protein